MKFSKGKLVASVLFFIMGALFLVFGVFRLVAGTVSRNVIMDASGGEESCSVTIAEVKEIGDEYAVTYGDETITYTTDFADYTIYEVTFSVLNNGVEELYSDDPGIYFEGNEYADVFELWMDGPTYVETPLFYYDGMPYVPAYSAAEVKKYIQVKDGVTELKAYYFSGYDDEEPVYLMFTID